MVLTEPTGDRQTFPIIRVEILKRMLLVSRPLAEKLWHS
jgi:hypothetical protein